MVWKFHIIWSKISDKFLRWHSPPPPALRTECMYTKEIFFSPIGLHVSFSFYLLLSLKICLHWTPPPPSNIAHSLLQMKYVLFVGGKHSLYGWYHYLMRMRKQKENLGMPTWLEIGFTQAQWAAWLANFFTSNVKKLGFPTLRKCYSLLFMRYIQ